MRPGDRVPLFIDLSFLLEEIHSRQLLLLCLVLRQGLALVHFSAQPRLVETKNAASTPPSAPQHIPHTLQTTPYNPYVRPLSRKKR